LGPALDPGPEEGADLGFPPKRAQIWASCRLNSWAARPPAAPVRSAVSEAPSIKPSGAPVAGSWMSTTAVMVGRPRAGLAGKTLTTFAPSARSGGTAAGM